MAALALAVLPLLHAPQGGDDLFQDVVLVLQQAQRHLLLVVVGAEVGQVHRRVGQVAAGLAAGQAQGLAGHRREVGLEAVAQRQELAPKVLAVCVGHGPLL